MTSAAASGVGKDDSRVAVAVAADNNSRPSCDHRRLAPVSAVRYSRGGRSRCNRRRRSAAGTTASAVAATGGSAVAATDAVAVAAGAGVASAATAVVAAGSSSRNPR